MKKFLCIPILLAGYFGITADKSDNPVEAGKVTWLHDYDEAIKKSTESGKPVFLLFQEIPG